MGSSSLKLSHVGCCRIRLQGSPPRMFDWIGMGRLGLHMYQGALLNFQSVAGRVEIRGVGRNDMKRRTIVSFVVVAILVFHLGKGRERGEVWKKGTQRRDRLVLGVMNKLYIDVLTIVFEVCVGGGGEVKVTLRFFTRTAVF